eukprot:3654852-Rhodomonas_salina.1
MPSCSLILRATTVTEIWLYAKSSCCPILCALLGRVRFFPSESAEADVPSERELSSTVRQMQHRSRAP